MKTKVQGALFFMVLAVATAVHQVPSWAVPTRPFDAPAKTKVVASAYYPGTQRVRSKLSCYWYPTVMVKEYDEGQKGAEWLSFVPIQAQEQPECTKSHIPDEKLIGKSDESEWVGYFWGVKGNFVFFTSDDGRNGGLPFAVYDSRTGKKIFEDSEYLLGMYGMKHPYYSPFNRMRISQVQRGPVMLTYLRVVEAGCDVRDASCWDRVQAKFDLKSSKSPVCFGYQGDPVGSQPSIVAYPVSVSLDSPPVVKIIAGPAKCWAPD